LEEVLDYQIDGFFIDTYMEVNKYVRLTNDVQSQDGWLWARSVLICDNADFFSLSEQKVGQLNSNSISNTMGPFQEMGLPFGQQQRRKCLVYFMN
jgi:hypothetical protein